MTKFKVGDKVRVNSSKVCVSLRSKEFEWLEITCIGDNVHYTAFNEVGNIVGTCWGCWGFGDFVPYEPGEKCEAKEVHFILQYELDRDPFETFATMKEVEARIKELAARPDLKRESIKVYEIARTLTVSLDTKVTFSGVKEEKPAPKKHKPHKKHVFKKTCPDCGAKVKSLGSHNRWNHSGNVKINRLAA